MKKLSLILVLLTIGFFAAKAQTKIGYTNVELILVYMPETQQMEQKLGAMEKKIQEQLQIKQQYYQQKAMEFLEAQESGTVPDAQMQVAQKELAKLQMEVQKGLQMAEQQLMKKRMELLTPIQNKMQIAIDAVATENGYTYILNNAMGSGIPTILHGNASKDCTEQIAAKLGIKTGE